MGVVDGPVLNARLVAYANETTNKQTKSKKQHVTASAKVQLRRQEIYEPSTPNVFTLCHPSVSLIYLFADSQQKAKKQTSRAVEKAKVAGQIKMQVLLECTKSKSESTRNARRDEVCKLRGRNGTELSQVQEMGE